MSLNIGLNKNSIVISKAFSIDGVVVNASGSHKMSLNTDSNPATESILLLSPGVAVPVPNL